MVKQVGSETFMTVMIQLFWNLDLDWTVALKAAIDLAAFHNKDLTSAFEEQFNLGLPDFHHWNCWL